ncbi:glycerate kinase [Subtercola endophyticus]|nr:glycerate kinase [Subtercola endophyticus]
MTGEADTSAAELVERVLASTAASDAENVGAGADGADGARDQGVAAGAGDVDGARDQAVAAGAGDADDARDQAGADGADGARDQAGADGARDRGVADGVPDVHAAGAGAAGGTGFGLLLWGASIHPGADAVGAAIGLPAQVERADVVITGEGRFDNQSAAGKVPSYVLALAQKYDTFPLLVAGAIETDPDDFAAFVSLAELAGSSAEAIANPKPFLHAAGRSLARGDAKTPAASA